jgi:hypothetical protein
MTEPAHGWPRPQLVVHRPDPDPAPDPAEPADHDLRPARGRHAATAALDAATVAQEKAQAASNVAGDWLADLWRRLVKWAGDGRSTSASRTGESLWATHPPSLADLWEYARSGGWVAGDRAPLLEFFGRIYGLGVLSFTAAVYGFLFVIQRPPRVGLAIGAIGIAWLAYHYL